MPSWPLRALLGVARGGHFGAIRRPIALRRAPLARRGALRRNRRWRCRYRRRGRVRPWHLVGRPRRRLRDGTHYRPPSVRASSLIPPGSVLQRSRPRTRPTVTLAVAARVLLAAAWWSRRRGTSCTSRRRGAGGPWRPRALVASAPRPRRRRLSC